MNTLIAALISMIAAAISAKSVLPAVELVSVLGRVGTVLQSQRSWV